MTHMPSGSPEHISLNLKTVAIPFAVAGLFWMAGGYPHRVPVAAWLLLVGGLMSATHYCLERARENPADGSGGFRRVPLTSLRLWSLNPSDYTPEGRIWFWRCWVGFALTALAWVLGNVAWG